MINPEFTATWEMPTLVKPRLSRSVGSGKLCPQPFVSRDDVIGSLSASQQLGQALLSAHRAGMAVVMSHKGVWTLDRFKGLWAPQVAVCDMSPTKCPHVGIHLGMLQANGDLPLRPYIHCPEAVHPTAEEAGYAQSIQHAFSEIPASTALFVRWAPGRCLYAATDVHTSIADVDGTRTIMVALQDAMAATQASTH